MKEVATAASAPTAESGAVEQTFSTDEGPVVITTRGNQVFIAESFDLPLARKLASLIFSAQGVGDERTARLEVPTANSHPGGAQPLSADLVRFFENCGVMKVAVDATVHIAH